MNEKEITTHELRVQEAFVEYFVCPNCCKPLYAKSNLSKCEDRFCGKCGHFILDHIRAALQ